MATELVPRLSLSQAKALVAHLEADQVDEANKIVESADISKTTERLMFGQVGELTRELHDALVNFQNDTRLIDMAGQELPDAKDRLKYVIEMTDKAANTTMDAVDYCLPIADKLIEDLEAITPNWNNLMTRNLSVGEFKTLCHAIDDLFGHSKIGAADVRSKLTEILMAQDFQDITGQLIKKVIDLVQDIESRLVVILTVCSDQEELKPETVKDSDENNTKDITAEGPIINAEERSDVVNGQDDVDDLLSSLGF
jgi:chemotaxis protein CheZ